MVGLKELIGLIPKISHEDKTLIEKAYFFAQRAHEGQKRKSGEPYFIHAVETAKNLATMGMDTKTIAAGLLHDVLEDTNTSEETLKKEFGEEIVTLVNGVTKIGKLRYQGVIRHVESLRKFFLAMTDDTRILIVKLADRLHNVETLKYVKPEKQKRIALETIEIHARLADRIGMGKLKGQLEDAAFPFAYPEDYAKVEKLLAEKSEHNQKELSRVTNVIRKELIDQKIHIVEISPRKKHLYSLWCKLKRYNMDIDKIYDIVALRVIVNTADDCYRVLGIIHNTFKPLPDRIKDYIANPKPNGYRSLHTSVFTGNGAIIEIQIRTPEMHAEAAYGIAAHFIYKEIGGVKKKNTYLQKNISWINQLKELQKITTEPIEFTNSLKMDLFKFRIFAFTPKGDVIDLPEDSSAIDFAYAVHTQIGDHAQSAKINGKIAQLFTKLHNHDIVEIKVNKNAHPSSKWLDHTKTTIAKKHINDYLKKNSLLARFRSFARFGK